MGKISVKVIPGSKEDKIMEENGMIKIKLKAKPIDGKANKYLISFLSKRLNTPKSKISIIKGEKRREKLLEISEFNDILIKDKLINGRNYGNE
jgi:uncharacterized protein (TIGR00251 family)